MVEDILVDIKRDYVLSKLRENERTDGRKFDEFRKIEIQPNVIFKAEGSALVKLGNTQVVVGIKMQVGAYAFPLLVVLDDLPEPPYIDGPAKLRELIQCELNELDTIKNWQQKK